VNNPVPPEDRNSGSRDYQDDPNALKANLFLQGTISIPQPAQQETHTDHNNTNEKRRDPFLNRFSVIASLFVGIALVVVGVLQFGVYSRQAKILKRQTHLINEQARISDDANILTKDIQRAYVIVTDLSVSTTTYDTSISWEYRPEITNVGNTQSANLGIIEIGPNSMRSMIGATFVRPLTIEQKREFCVARQLGTPVDPDTFFHSPDLRGDTNTRIFNFIVGPKQPGKYPAVESRIGNSIGANIIGGALEMLPIDWPYFFGEIVYNDVFPELPITLLNIVFRQMAFRPATLLIPVGTS
jgi:hypothetical protein